MFEEGDLPFGEVKNIFKKMMVWEKGVSWRKNDNGFGD
jgi:hypothetical protein